MLAEEKSRVEVALEEYRTVRSEIVHALQAQQTILTWSLGIIGVTLAGALASAGHSSVRLDLLRLAVSGFAFPILVFGASLAWLGELIRAERGGFYLRGRERAFWRVPCWNLKDDTLTFNKLWTRDPASYPALWENFLSFGRQGLGTGKQAVGYIGALLIYGCSVLFSLAAFAWLLHQHRFGSSDEEWTLAGYAWAGAFLGLAWLTLVGVPLRLNSISKQAFGQPGKVNGAPKGSGLELVIVRCARR